MASAQLLQKLQSDDDTLERTLRGGKDGGDAGIANAQAIMDRMKGTIAELRKVQPAVPKDQSGRINRQCEDYERRLSAHRKVLQARIDESKRAQLWKGRPGAREDKGKPTLEEEGARAEVQALQRGHETMHRTLEQMQHTTRAMDDSSRGIRKVKDQYGTYSDKLRSASQVLGHLKRKTEEDSRYIWWSFCYFVSVVVYIMLKRMKVFKLMYAGAAWTWWSGSTAAGLVQDASTQLVYFYQVFCETLGIPSALEAGLAGATLG